MLCTSGLASLGIVGRAWHCRLLSQLSAFRTSIAGIQTAALLGGGVRQRDVADKSLSAPLNEFNNGYSEPLRRWWEQVRGCQSQKQSEGNRSESLYVHYAAGFGHDTLPATLGLMHTLERHAPNIGYFRPIASEGLDRAAIIKKVFSLKDDLTEMKALSQQEALDLLANNQLDTLLDQTLAAYEEYKRKHEFVLVDGSGFRDLKMRLDTAALDAKIAETLSCPAFIVTNCSSFTRRSGEKPREHVPPYEQFEHELVNATLVASNAFVNERVEVVGAMAHRVPLPYTNKETAELIRSKLQKHRVYYAGHLPDDPRLTAATVHDVQSTLGAELIHGGEVPGQLSTEVTQFVVATIQLQDLLVYLPTRLDPTQGAAVITNADRPDVLLGMIALQRSSELANVASIVLTGGKPISPQIEAILQKYQPEELLPVLMARMSTFDAATALANVEGHVTAETSRKIERAQILFDENVEFEPVLSTLMRDRPKKMSPKLFVFNIFQKAKQDKQHIVLPEGTEPRVVQAAGEVLRRGLGKLTLLGDVDEILTVAKQQRVHLADAQLVDPLKSPLLEKYANLLYEKRKHKGLTLEYAQQQATADLNVFGTCMVEAGDADGMVSGAIHTTANTVRPALQVIKVDPAIGLVSSIFFMCLPERVLVYGDCAINLDPTAEELAKIAISSADSARDFDIEPRVALLSYATGDSGAGPQVQKVKEATALVKKLRPDIPVEGPIQYDAAVDPEIAKIKFKGKKSPVAGRATVLIFPDLNTGNNTYKAVQQSTGAIAIGPMLQGLRKPVNDLSRGCTVKDVVTTVAITAIQAQARKAKGAVVPPANNHQEARVAAAGA